MIYNQFKVSKVLFCNEIGQKPIYHINGKTQPRVAWSAKYLKVRNILRSFVMIVPVRILNRFLLTKGLRTRTRLPLTKPCCLFCQWKGTKWVFFFKHLYFQEIFLHLKMGRKKGVFFSIWQFFKISKNISHLKF